MFNEGLRCQARMEHWCHDVWRYYGYQTFSFLFLLRRELHQIYIILLTMSFIVIVIIVVNNRLKLRTNVLRLLNTTRLSLETPWWKQCWCSLVGIASQAQVLPDCYAVRMTFVVTAGFCWNTESYGNQIPQDCHGSTGGYCQQNIQTSEH